LEAKDRVINHLLFHKALIDEHDDGGRISRYIEMISNDESALVIEDEIERAIYIALKLAVEEKFDPWNIDLVRFSKLYIERIREEGSVDLVVAGRILFMAWCVLKMQSDSLVERAEQSYNADLYAEEYEDDYIIFPAVQETAQDEVIEVIAEGENEIRLEVRPRMMRRAPRKVTLMELVEAFDEVRKEAELQRKVNEVRERLRSKQRRSVGENVHKEEIEEDIEKTWNAIVSLGEKKMRFASILNTGIDLVSAFISILFLAKEGKIALHQENIPYGDIIIEVIADNESAGKSSIEVKECEEIEVTV